MKNYLLAFKNILNFKGEASNSEFWNYFIINILVSVLITYPLMKLDIYDYVYPVYSTITTITLVSLGFRRLKNAGFSGWFFLIPFANLILASLPEKEK